MADPQSSAQQISDAPKSVLDGVQLPSFVGFQFDFKPQFESLPTLELASDLPLGRLADFSFNGGTNMSSIAPSVGSMPSASGSGDLALGGASGRVRQPQSGVPTSSQPSLAVVSAPAPAASSSLPQLTGPSAPAPASTSIASSIPNAPAAPPLIAAPPPPPAPPAPVASESVPPPAAPSGSGRGALLDQIRDMNNLKRLKKSKKTEQRDQRISSKKGDAPAAAVPESAPAVADDPGDMMAQLRAAMMNRSRALKGNVDPVAASGPRPAAPSVFQVPTLRKPPSAKPASESVDSETAAVSAHYFSFLLSTNRCPSLQSAGLSTAVLKAYVEKHNEAQSDDWE